MQIAVNMVDSLNYVLKSKFAKTKRLHIVAIDNLMNREYYVNHEKETV
jgi:hypothetical protein